MSVGEVDKTSEYMTRSSDNKKVTIAIPAIAAVGNIIYAAGAVKEIVQLATPTIAMNADGKTLEITDVENATSYDVYVDGTLKTNVAKASVPVSFTLYMKNGDTGDTVPTYIKLDSTPANANDYDYVVKGDGSHEYDSDYLFNKAGTKILDTVTLSARYVYVWGWYVYVNDVGEPLYGGNKTYDKALKITLSQNDNIKIQCQYTYD